jgi:hypothetical protein
MKKQSDFKAVVPKRKIYADSKERREGDLFLTVRPNGLGVFSTRCLDDLLKDIMTVAITWNSEDMMLKMQKTERTVYVSKITYQKNESGTRTILARIALASVFSSIGLRDALSRKMMGKKSLRFPIIPLTKNTWIVNLEGLK